MDVSDDGKTVKCTLCGAEFEPGGNTCGGCALRKDCKLICCPNCGFEFPEESKLVTWLKGFKKGSE